MATSTATSTPMVAECQGQRLAGRCVATLASDAICALFLLYAACVYCGISQEAVHSDRDTEEPLLPQRAAKRKVVSNFSCVFAATLLSLAPILQLVLAAYTIHTMPTTDQYCSAALAFVAWIVCAKLMYSRKPFLCRLWVVANVLCQAFMLYTTIRMHSGPFSVDDDASSNVGFSSHPDVFVFFTSFALLFCLLIDIGCNPDKLLRECDSDTEESDRIEALEEVVGDVGDAQRLTETVGLSRKVSSPEDNAGIVSIYTFWWMWPILTSAYEKGKLEDSDIPALPKNDRPRRLVDAFAKIIPGLKKGACLGRATNLFLSLSYSIQRPVFWFSFLHGWLFQVLACMLLDPIVLNVLLKRSQGNADASLSLLLVLGLSVSMAVRVTCMEITYFASVRVANNGRTALVYTVFKKALALAHGTSASEYDAGILTNLMATDADKIGKSWWVTGFWSQWTWAVLSLPLVTFFLHRLVGNAAFVAIATIIVTNYINLRVGQVTQPVVRRLQERRDERSSLLKELLMSIKVVKLMVGEEQWRLRLQEIRKREIRELACQRYLTAINDLVGSLVSVAIPVSIFAFYTQVEHKTLDSATAFTALAWISQMQWSINTLPSIYNLYASLEPSCERLAKFFSLPNLAPVSDSTEEPNTLDSESSYVLVTAIHADMGYFESVPCKEEGGDSEEDEGAENEVEGMGQKVIIGDCNVEVCAGELVVIVGPVGVGKSTLLQGLASARPILNDAAPNLVDDDGRSDGRSEVRGRLNVSTSRAYVGQKPFLMNGTIEENILFGLPLKRGAYAECMRRAALVQDLANLPCGDKTHVGEGGVQLSGGQKARVAFARALYADAEVYFLDDVLSAVDAHTGRHLWEEGILPLLRGALKGSSGSGARPHSVKKAVILVTHQLQYVTRPEVSRVMILKNGGIWLDGPWAELAPKAGDMSRFVQPAADSSDSCADDSKSSVNEETEAEDPGASALSLFATSPSSSPHSPSRDNNNDGNDDNDDDCNSAAVTLDECEQFVTATLQQWEGRTVTRALIQQMSRLLSSEKEKSEEAGGGAGEDEEQHEGVIAWVDFKVYLKEFGSCFTLVLLLLCAVCAAAFTVLGNIWLSLWTEKAGDSENAQQRYLFVYIAIGCAGALTAALQTVLLTLCALRASFVLHDNMLMRLLYAPMSFFDSTPAGQVMNRFLQDMANVDNFVPNAILDQCTKTLTVITQISLVFIFAPWCIFVMPLLLPSYYYIFKRVRTASRDARRLEARAHSPVYTHFADALAGRQTIAAFGAEKRFIKRNLQLTTAMASANYTREAAQKWAQALTTQTGCVLYLASGMVCVLLATHRPRSLMTSSQMGLVLLYAAQLQRAMMDYMMGLTSLETQFVSVERIAEYTRMPGERIAAEEAVGGVAVPAPLLVSEENAGFLPHGAVEFRDVKMRYRLNKPMVLNGISFVVPAGAKVAVCGRTGCGKSTLFGVVCRLYPLCGGQILLDGTDIHAPHAHATATATVTASASGSGGGVSLSHLRSAVRVVTQDACLVGKTLRSSLLPATAATAAPAPRAARAEAASASDDMLWRALEQVSMVERVRDLPGGLGSTIVEGGATFSAGERQLLTLARALVPQPHPPRLLLCDEATANVDLATDEQVHQILTSIDATVLMICHRLQHLPRFDAVIVVDAGVVVEYGPPSELLRTPDSILSSLYKEAGLSSTS